MSMVRSSMRVVHAAINTTVISRSLSVSGCAMSTTLLNWVKEHENTEMSAAISRASYSADSIMLATLRRVLASSALAPARVMMEAANPMISAMMMLFLF